MVEEKNSHTEKRKIFCLKLKAAINTAWHHSKPQNIYCIYSNKYYYYYSNKY